jgi:Transposase IS66 family.
MPIEITRDEIRAIYRQGEDAVVTLIESLVARINELEKDVAELKAKVNKDSHNSSKPPSSDMFRPPKSLREKSDKPRGGQPGHNGRSLRQIESPDHIKEHSLQGTCECGRRLSEGKFRGKERRQVFDIPNPTIEVTEHRAEIRACACGLLHTADFPAGVEAPVQYGPRIRGMLVYLSQYQLLPQKRITETMRDLFSAQISQGTINNAIVQAYYRLQITEETIKQSIAASAVVHGDETGIYVGGKRLWQHNLSTALYTYFFCHVKRGKKALRDDGILHRFIGRLVHDGWLSYFDFDCLHALCNAHHLRELIFLSECGHRWATTMTHLLCQIKKVVDRGKKAGRKQLAPQTLHRFRKRYESIIKAGYHANPVATQRIKTGSRGRIKQSAARNLLDRLDKYAEETLAFMYDFNIPFDNNQAERDLRMSKVKQKVSGCFRSMFGAQAFCRIRGYISTLRKHGLDVFDNLVNCFDPSIEQKLLLPKEAR